MDIFPCFLVFITDFFVAAMVFSFHVCHFAVSQEVLFWIKSFVDECGESITTEQLKDFEQWQGGNRRCTTSTTSTTCTTTTTTECSSTYTYNASASRTTSSSSTSCTTSNDIIDCVSH
ncbi:hypothetical protein RND81_14G122400 [Saponaria officinalis]|uniref:Uncharacterized protein n=1 Tax=Saponaria officinalis TaxID=3572 RepID=A0AAW1GM80_SAPOF